MASKILKWGAGLGLGLLVTAFIRKAGNLHTAGKLIIDIEKVAITGFDKLYLTLKVSNPTPGTVTFDSINTELYFNEINIGRLYYNIPVMIARNSDKSFVFPVILYPAGILQLATNILQKKSKTGIFRIEGSTYVNGIPVPINKAIKSW